MNHESCTNESTSKPDGLQPDRSQLDQRKTLFWRHRCYGAEGCKHRFRPNASRYKARICRPATQSHINTKPQQLSRFTGDRLKETDVASRYYDELESELQGVQAQPLSLDEKCKKREETIQRLATNAIGYTRKQANKNKQKWTRKRTPPSQSKPSRTTPEEPRMLTS
jgi:hypothetical protein